VQERPKPPMLIEKCKTGYQKKRWNKCLLPSTKVWSEKWKVPLEGLAEVSLHKKSKQVSIAIHKANGLPF
jgi:hypothetical protein